MKKKLTFLLAFALISCASIDSKVARLSTSELELRRQQIQYRLAATAAQWSFGGGPVRIGAPTIGEYTEQIRHEVGPGSQDVIRGHVRRFRASGHKRCDDARAKQ